MNSSTMNLVTSFANPLRIGARRRYPARLRPALLLLVAACGTVGCGGPASPQGTVSGRVTFAGDGVPNATVVFEAAGGELTVTTDADDTGRYRARRSAEMAGLPPGDYRVTVTPPLYYPGLGPVDAAPPERPDIPQKYRDPATSGLALTVLDGDDHPYDIMMEP